MYRRALLPLALLLAACGGEAPPAAPLQLRVGHVLGGAPLQLGQIARLADGSSVSISRLLYYVGGLRVQDAQGRWFESTRAAEPAGDYALIDAGNPASLSFDGPALPPGRYRSLELRLGVDAVRNAGGPQTGALDPAHGMYWTWKTGFIFFDLEGLSSRSAGLGGAVTWHAGGDDSVLRTLVLPLEGFEVSRTGAAVLELRADLDELFRAVDLQQSHSVMDATGSGPLADAYAAMFRVVTPAPVQSAP